MEDIIKRCNTYKFLSNCYYTPNIERINELHSYKKHIPETYSILEKNIPSYNNLEKHLIDYSRLFLGPLNLLAPPYGSVYLEGRNKLMGESTNNVISWYKAENVKLKINDVPDHIAIELEFMYLLILRELNAKQDQDEDAICKYQKKQKDFMDLHLGSWVNGFTNKLESAATTIFYRNLAGVTRNFIAQDLLMLNNIKFQEYMA
jgi:TorA maturation chaperone TorD